MDYQKVIEQARTCIGPYCKACAVCNGRACKNTMPGPGAKGIGDVAIQSGNRLYPYQYDEQFPDVSVR